MRTQDREIGMTNWRGGGGLLGSQLEAKKKPPVRLAPPPQNHFVLLHDFPSLGNISFANERDNNEIIANDNVAALENSVLSFLHSFGEGKAVNCVVPHYESRAPFSLGSPHTYVVCLEICPGDFPTI